jgi:hypothetical protein
MVIPLLADILNATEKEKVKRIILSAFRVKLVTFIKNRKMIQYNY